MKRFEGVLVRAEREKKWDLYLVSKTVIELHPAYTQPNHLLSAPPVFLKLHFRNTTDLYTVRRELLPLAQANSAKFTAVDAYADIVGAQKQNGGGGGIDGEEGTMEEAWGAEDISKKDKEPAECIVDVREYDINYYLRVAIDLGGSGKEEVMG
jgi:DNA polymerase epsilon subunit 1